MQSFFIESVNSSTQKQPPKINLPKGINNILTSKSSRLIDTTDSPHGGQNVTTDGNVNF